MKSKLSITTERGLIAVEDEVAALQGKLLAIDGQRQHRVGVAGAEAVSELELDASFCVAQALLDVEPPEQESRHAYHFIVSFGPWCRNVMKSVRDCRLPSDTFVSAVIRHVAGCMLPGYMIREI